MELTDNELMQEYYLAVECQDGKKIEELKEEMSRRNREE
jgi:hypothetical protein